jgi:hypothetical protein
MVTFWIRRATYYLTVTAAISTAATGQSPSYPGKPEWSTTPTIVRPAQGKYPSPVTAVLYLDSCQTQPASGGTKTVLDSDTGHVYKISPSGVGITASTPAVGDCTLTTTLTIDPATQPGDYLLTVTETTTSPASTGGKGLGILSLLDPTAGPTPGKPEVDVMWDAMSGHVCSDDFGNHLPRYLYCIEVKIGNNSAHSLQLAGIGFKRKNPLAGVANSGITQDAVLISPNTSYQTSRAVAQAGGGTTARNIIYNSVQALGLVMASFSPFFHNQGNAFRWATGTTIVSGALLQGIAIVAPDLTLRELNNLDDQSFRDGKLIPNNTQVRMIVFVDKATVANALAATCKSLYSAVSKDLASCKSNPKPTDVKLSLGDMVLVGTQIDFLQRIVVDTSVTSQEVNPGPTVVRLSPNPLAPGAPLLITGTGFGATQGSSTVKFGTTAAAAGDISGWSDIAITVKAPTAIAPGSQKVVVSVGGKDSSPADLTISGSTSAPAITSVKPPSAAPTAPVVLAGTGFGATQGTSTVKFGTIAAAATDVTNWSNISITVKIPAGVTPGPSKIVVNVGGKDSAAADITITAATSVPKITSVKPPSAAPTTPVVLAGTGFGATQGTSTVKFGTIAAAATDVTNWSNISITVKVPAGVTPGASKIVVNVGGKDSAAATITVTK